jgi:hypothetical protein
MNRPPSDQRGLDAVQRRPGRDRFPRWREKSVSRRCIVHTTQLDQPHKALWSSVVGAFLATVATIVVLAPLLSNPPSTANPGELGPPVAVSVASDPATRDQGPEGCTVAQMVEPGEYESLERTASVRATWVIIPDTYEQIVPAPLYVLSVADFTGGTSELDMLRPIFEALDGVVVVTGVAGTGDEFTTLVDEVKQDFCIDAERVVTSMVPSPESPTSPGPKPATPREETLVT